MYLPLQADVLSRLALAIELQERLTDSESADEFALQAYRKAGDPTPQYVGTLQGYADLLRKIGNLDKALELFEKAIIAIDLLPQAAETADLRWSIHHNRARVYIELEQFHRAVPILLDLVALSDDTLPGTRRDAIAHSELGIALQGMRQYDLSQEHFETALRINLSLNSRSNDVAKSYNLLGELAGVHAISDSGGDWDRYRSSTWLTRSAAHFEAAASIRNGGIGSIEDRALSLFNLGTSLASDPVAARRTRFEQALELYRMVAPKHILAAGVLTKLAAAMHHSGELDEPIALLNEAISIIESGERAGAWEYPGKRAPVRRISRRISDARGHSF